MRFSIDVGSELELKLYQALLLYKNDHGNRHMATVHGVVQTKRRWKSRSWCRTTAQYGSLRELARQLGTGCPVEFLPDDGRRANPRPAGMVDAGGGAANVLPSRIGTAGHFWQTLSPPSVAVRRPQQCFVRSRAFRQPEAGCRQQIGGSALLEHR